MLHEIHWDRIILTELTFILTVMMGLGFIKAPRFLMRKRLARGYPWGYYADKVPKKDPGFTGGEDDEDFLHNTESEFGGLEGFGDYGEFSGFGELGEYGQSFFGGGDSAGGFGGD